MAVRTGVPLVTRQGDVYLEDNLATDVAGKAVPMTRGSGVVVLTEKPIWLEGLEPIPAARTLEHVIRHAGARPRDRDAIDQRIIDDLKARRGRIIDSQEEVGGYPGYAMTRRALDVPAGKVDEWLASFAAAVE